METGLAVTKSELDAIIGFELGYGRDPAGWDENESATCLDMIRSGQRLVYTPVIAAGNTATHRWSFLRLLHQLTFASAARIVSLPADFAFFEGQIVVTNDGVIVCPIRLSADARVYRHERPDTTGRPQVAELEWVSGPSAEMGQRARLHIWPTADQAYTLEFAYHVNPDALADERPFAYGGPAHAETFRAACLAACEFYVHNERGNRWSYFQEQLARSVSHDRLLKPEVLGYMGGKHPEFGGRFMYRRGWGWPALTVNGTAIT